MIENRSEATEALLLDEHFPPVVAELLRQAGFDVVGVAEDPAMRGTPDEAVFLYAVSQGRRVVTENVRDFLPLLVAAMGNAKPVAPLLLTTSKHHPRSQIGHLVSSLASWLQQTDRPKQLEEWL